jgi:nucleotide-binding universal stress UspA family protein
MENENKNVVLVAYDFTSVGDMAIENAVQLAKLLSYRMYLLHVINNPSKQNLKKSKESLESLKPKLEKIAADISKKHSIEVDFDAKEGSIFTTISDTINQIGANFLFFGTHGKKGIQLITGSFAMKLIKSCPIPVIVVQQSKVGNSFSDVVFPLDLESGSKQKVKWAISHNDQIKSTFHIFVENHSDEYIQRRLNADLNQVKKIMEKHNISFTENKSPKGDFARNCSDFAKKIKADMIMLATDPDKITWNLLGSPAERLIYNPEKLPVMCINAQDLKVFIGGM